MLLPILALLGLVAPVGAAVNTATPLAIAQAIAGPGTLVANATLSGSTGGTPNGISTAPLAGFGATGDNFGILTTGNVASVPVPTAIANTTNNANVFSSRGNSAYDVSTLKVDINVPQGANCLTFDFKFLTTEFPGYVNTEYNDGFIAELDSSTWTTNGSVISAPNNFAFDSTGKVVSVNLTGLGGMSATLGAGTAFSGQRTYANYSVTEVSGPVGGATALLRASKPITAPGPHSVYFSIFDQGDNAFDSAVFLNNLVVGFVPNPAANCVPGVIVTNYRLALAPPTGNAPVGTAHTVTATLTNAVTNQPVANQTIGFTVAGVNPQSGTGTTNASGQATFTYTGTNAGTDQIAACYQPSGAAVCLAQASATMQWTAPPTILTVGDATGVYGGTVTLSASLTKLGLPFPGQSVQFTLNGAVVGTAATEANGVATLTPATPLGVIGAGSYPTGIGATFAGSPSAQASSDTGTLTVTPAPLTVTADDTTVTYGGTASFTFTASGLVGTDTVTTAFTTRPTCAPAGTAIVCSGGVAPNYAITYADGVLTTTPAPLTVTAADKSRAYGAADPTFTATFGGFVNGDAASDLGGTLTFATTATAASGVGDYAITPSGLTSTNYAITFVPGTLKVTRAALTVTADDKTREYGAPNPALTGTLAGVVAGDDITATYGTMADASSPVGSYPITPALADPGNRLGNYAVTATNGTLHVTQGSTTTTVTAGNATYDGNPHGGSASVTGGGLNQGLAVSYVGRNGTVYNSATAPTNAGDYTASASYAGDANRIGSSDTADFTIAKAPSTTTVTAPTNLVFDGSPKVATAQTTGVGGAIATPAVTYTPGPGAPVNPGTYSASATFPGDPNHEPSSDSITFTIAKAVLTVTADNKVKILGAANPTLTVTITGFLNGDTASALSGSPALSTTAAVNSPVGTYPITVSQSTLSSLTYSFTFVNGTLAVQYAGAGTPCAGADGRTVLQPVNADGTSVFKQGSTVPVKFRACDANGASIGTPGVVTSFRLVQKTTGTVSQAVNEPVDSTTPDSTFRWSGDQWIFNLNTKSLSAGSTYTYEIALNDGTTITFKFGLK